jgi:threonine dehydrogenase-like Zn-dependent dehydrogenase
MRAFVIEAPGRAGVREVPVPDPGPAQVVVRVERAGVCGTDAELFDGSIPYLHDGTARYPLRPGHEWSGRVLALGPGVLVGLAGTPSTIDTRRVVLRDVTVRGLLAASHGLDQAIAALASGALDPRPLIGRVVALEDLADVLGAPHPAPSGAPKVQVDPLLAPASATGSTDRASCSRGGQGAGGAVSRSERPTSR